MPKGEHLTRQHQVNAGKGCAGYLSDPPGVIGVENTTLEFPIG